MSYDQHESTKLFLQSQLFTLAPQGTKVFCTQIKIAAYITLT